MDALTQESPLLSMTPEVLSRIGHLQDAMLRAPQIEIKTEHVIHAGIYTRTIRLDAGVVLVGALIKIPTTLIISGKTAVFVGDKWIGTEGYQIIPAKAGRKQIFVTKEPTTITMSFRTNARTIEEVEREFTDEAELLISHREGEGDTVVITGD